jgi:uncharacterized C2H2 Zn-finger protein
MSQIVRCPECGYSAKIRRRGGKIELRCPMCGKEFVVYI